jgi:translation initiation factor 3 subunit G
MTTENLETKKNVGQSWADQMDDGHEGYHRPIPHDRERIEGDMKIVEHWEFDEDQNKLLKYTRYYKIEKIKVPKSIAKRKQWKKFGKAADDGEGPNPSNTQVTDEVTMDFIRPESDAKVASQEDAFKNAKAGKGMVKCRFCDMDHWSTNCPYKDKMSALVKPGADDLGAKGGLDDASKVMGGRYVPPSRRGDTGTGRTGEMMSSGRNKDEANTIRVTNLPEDVQDNDIKDLFKPFGRVSRIFLARDKFTGQSKGFAFVSFDLREDAQMAILGVNGHGYANLILSVEWAKPSGNS